MKEAFWLFRSIHCENKGQVVFKRRLKGVKVKMMMISKRMQWISLRSLTEKAKKAVTSW